MDDINEDHQEASARSPLLRQDSPKSSSKVSVDEGYAIDGPWHQIHLSAIATHLDKWKIPYIIGAFTFCIDFGGFLSAPSQLRMLEAAICRRYYTVENPLLIDVYGDVPEKLCKIDPVQEEVAFIMGWKQSLDSLVSVIVAIPWGVIADKKGRRLVAFLCVLSVYLDQIWYYAVCYFHRALPPRTIFASSAFFTIGGGATVLMAVLIGIVVDATSPDVRALVLFQLQAVILGSLLLGPLLGALALARLGYWIPSGIGLAIETLSTVSLIWLPNYSRATHHHVTGGGEEIAEVGGDTNAEHESRRDTDQSVLAVMTSKASSSLSSIAGVFDLIFKNSTLAIGLAAFVATKAGAPIIMFLPQFASKRFGWSISDASYISSVQAGVSIIMLMVVLPTITKIFKSRYQISGPSLDLRLLRGSIPFLTLGCFLLGWASTPTLFIIALIIYVMGIGFRPALESFLASAVRPDQMATLYVAISVVDTLGQMVSSPLLALGFAEGLHMGGAWIGLPFIAVSIVFAFSAIFTGFLRVRERVQAEQTAVH